MTRRFKVLDSSNLPMNVNFDGLTLDYVRDRPELGQVTLKQPSNGGVVSFDYANVVEVTEPAVAAQKPPRAPIITVHALYRSGPNSAYPWNGQEMISVTETKKEAEDALLVADRPSRSLKERKLRIQQKSFVKINGEWFSKNIRPEPKGKLTGFLDFLARKKGLVPEETLPTNNPQPLRKENGNAPAPESHPGAAQQGDDLDDFHAAERRSRV